MKVVLPPEQYRDRDMDRVFFLDDGLPGGVFCVIQSQGVHGGLKMGIETRCGLGLSLLVFFSFEAKSCSEPDFERSWYREWDARDYGSTLNLNDGQQARWISQVLSWCYRLLLMVGCFYKL